MSVLCVFAVFFKFLLLLYAYRFFMFVKVLNAENISV